MLLDLCSEALFFRCLLLLQFRCVCPFPAFSARSAAWLFFAVFLSLFISIFQWPRFRILLLGVALAVFFVVVSFGFYYVYDEDYYCILDDFGPLPAFSARSAARSVCFVYDEYHYCIIDSKSKNPKGSRFYQQMLECERFYVQRWARRFDRPVYCLQNMFMYVLWFWLSI